MQEFEIFIPSKGRPDNKTASLIKRYSYKLVVEPQDYEAYLHCHSKDNIICMDKNNAGISYARNFILNLAKTKYILMCDDDIYRASQYINGKNIEIDFDRAICEFYNYVTDNDIDISSIIYRQYQWSASVNYDRVAECCVLINTDFAKAHDIHYDSFVDMKEDKDFWLQFKIHGAKTKTFVKFGIRVPHTSENKGGLYNDYKNNKDILAFMNFYNKWRSYGIVKLINNRRGKDIAVKYNMFKASL